MGMSDKGESDLGTSLSYGYVNDDNLSDIIIGCQFCSPGPYAEGAVFVIFGRTVWPQVINISSPNFTQYGTIIKGQQFAGFIGSSVAACDVDGDGRDDVIVGAYHTSPLYRSSAGQAYIVFGM